MVVETALGKPGPGFGSMPLGNVWAFPSRLTYDQTLAAMKDLAGRIAGLYRMCGLAATRSTSPTLEPRFFLAGDDFAQMNQPRAADAEARDARRRHRRSTRPCTTPSARCTG